MRICISSTGSDINSKLEINFEKSRNFVIIDTETMEYEFLTNPCLSMYEYGENTGEILAAQYIANAGANLVFTGNIKYITLSILQGAGIKIMTGLSERPIIELVDQYKSGKLRVLPLPSAGAYASGLGLARGMGAGTGRVSRKKKLQPEREKILRGFGTELTDQVSDPAQLKDNENKANHTK